MLQNGLANFNEVCVLCVNLFAHLEVVLGALVPPDEVLHARDSLGPCFEVSHLIGVGGFAADDAWARNE